MSLLRNAFNSLSPSSSRSSFLLFSSSSPFTSPANGSVLLFTLFLILCFLTLASYPLLPKAFLYHIFFASGPFILLLRLTSLILVFFFYLLYISLIPLSLTLYFPFLTSYVFLISLLLLLPNFVLYFCTFSLFPIPFNFTPHSLLSISHPLLPTPSYPLLFSCPKCLFFFFFFLVILSYDSFSILS